MSDRDQERIRELRAALKIAKGALGCIAGGRSDDPQMTAIEARDEIFRLEAKQPLQGLVGHGASHD